MAFHVTLESNLKSIKKHGLVPKIGERSQKLGESCPAVYLFINIEECHNALSNWLGEEYDDIEEDLVILEVEIDECCFEIDTEGDVFFEIAVGEVINPSRILNIYQENLKYENGKIKCINY
jgi:hypothetical protein